MKYKILPQKNSQRVNSTKTRIKTKNLLLFIKKILYLQRISLMKCTAKIMKISLLSSKFNENFSQITYFRMILNK